MIEIAENTVFNPYIGELHGVVYREIMDYLFANSDQFSLKASEHTFSEKCLKANGIDFLLNPTKRVVNDKEKLVYFERDQQAYKFFIQQNNLIRDLRWKKVYDNGKFKELPFEEMAFYLDGVRWFYTTTGDAQVGVLLTSYAQLLPIIKKRHLPYYHAEVEKNVKAVAENEKVLFNDYKNIGKWLSHQESALQFGAVRYFKPQNHFLLKYLSQDLVDTINKSWNDAALKTKITLDIIEQASEIQRIVEEDFFDVLQKLWC